jgi:hypothetical protein
MLSSVKSSVQRIVIRLFSYPGNFIRNVSWKLSKVYKHPLILFNFLPVTRHKSHTNVKEIDLFMQMTTPCRNWNSLNRRKKPFRLYLIAVVSQHFTTLFTQVDFKAMLWRKGIETIINFASKHHKNITFDFAL